MENDIEARLENWGDWLCYEIDIGPKHVACGSLESRYMAPSGEVWDGMVEGVPMPDTVDAELVQAMISRLGSSSQYALAITYARFPAVIRMRRMDPQRASRLAQEAVEILRAGGDT